MSAAGKMTPAGLKRIVAAKEDGSWSTLDAIENLEVPSDLPIDLKQHAPADSFFDAFPRSVKGGILEWILNANRPETRERRIKETAYMAANNERANQWKKKK